MLAMANCLLFELIIENYWQIQFKSESKDIIINLSTLIWIESLTFCPALLSFCVMLFSPVLNMLFIHHLKGWRAGQKWSFLIHCNSNSNSNRNNNHVHRISDFHLKKTWIKWSNFVVIALFSEKYLTALKKNYCVYFVACENSFNTSLVRKWMENWDEKDF